MNNLCASGTPFFFFTDFLGSRAWVRPLHELDDKELSFDFSDQPLPPPAHFTFAKYPPTFESFSTAYRQVIDQINYGNSYLVNLTFRTPIETNLTLADIYAVSRAQYKVLFRNCFVVFSPETFVKIQDGRIHTYPMKGTIDASVPEARKKILEDPKETAEHVTIVDLLRNDLSQVANQVEVSRFRYVSEVKTHEKTLLQVSSEITGVLKPQLGKQLGDVLFRLLPAGSVSGAPKARTVEIIRQTENYERGFYTGVCGVYDGHSLDSAVMIRYIEQEEGRLYYKSGGGITSFSKAEKEYQEIVDKVYVPVY